MRRATSDTAFKMVCRDRRMDRGARLGVNQGEAEGVDFRPRLKLSPQICPQDCPRGAAAGRFLWDSCGYLYEIFVKQVEKIRYDAILNEYYQYRKLKLMERG